MMGAWATTGFSLDRLDRIEEKISFRSYVFALPSTFRVSGVEKLVQLVFDPLEAGVGKMWK